MQYAQDLNMPKPYGTPGSVGYVNPFAPKTPEPDASVVDPLKEQFNSIATGINAYRTSKKPAEEPAVLSSEGAQEKVDDAHTKLANMSKKGTTMDATTGNSLFADGSLVPAPQGSTYDEGSGQYQYNGKTYGAAQFYDDSNPDEDYTAIQKLFTPLKESLDADTLASVNAIEQQFNSYRTMTDDINRRAEQSRSRSLSLGGTTRYAPFTATGLSMNEASLGLSRIQSLDARENMALAQAKSAQTEGNFKIMTQALSMAEDVRKEKQTQAMKVMDSISKANDDLVTKRKQLQLDEAVADLMTQGVTDPAKMLDFLNNYEDGTSTGRNATAAEIASSIKNLTPTTTDKKAMYKFTNEDVGKMFGAGMTAPLIQQVQDYYNGVDANMPNLTSAQTMAVHTILSGKTTDGPIGFTPTQKLQLEQAGLAAALRQDQLDFLFGKQNEQGDYDMAKKFLADNPDASREELSAALHEKTKLSVSDINALLDEKGAIKEAASIDGQEDAIAVALVKSQGFLGDAQAAKDYIDSAKELDINNKMVKLSARQIQAIKDAIDKAYPGGTRSLIQSVLPGGK